MMKRLLLVAAGALGLAACYSTPTPECAFACSVAGSAECPAGYSCRNDGMCKLEGVADDFACPNLDSDAASIDAPPGIDATDGPQIDAPDIDAPDIDAAIDAATPVDAIDAPPPIDAFAGLRITTTGPVAFGNVTAGMMDTMPVTVTNDGSATTTALTVTVTQTGGGTEYTLTTPDNCTGQTLTMGENCTFTVQFAPTDAGAETGSAMVSAATGGNSAINLTGSGQ
jgi:hypothetical protein